jgi:hypothetical protein
VTVDLVVIKNVIVIITAKIVAETREVTIIKNVFRSARKKNNVARKTAKSRDIIVNKAS